MEKQLVQETTQHFRDTFQTDPKHLFLSPGRINIIGEHVDYNDGFVLPAAIDKYICFAIAESNSQNCTIVAKDLQDSYTFSLDNAVIPIGKMWVNYILGVLSQLIERDFPIKGFNIVFSSNIPIGAGLSSSAALECGFAFAMNDIFDLGLTKEEIAIIGQKSEHTFVGVKCGIMDQFASVFGKENHVIKLDCTSLEYEYHKADFTNYSLLLLDSHVKHTHLTSGYNDRRAEVESGLKILKQQFPQISSFRDCTEEHVDEAREILGEIRYKRCHFVVREIARVLQAVTALDNDDFQKLGKLMYETHDGLSNGYEISCDELDFLVNVVKDEPVVLGARMMGGGFGGCSINLVKKGAEDELITTIAAAYRKAFNIELSAYKVNISAGTSRYIV